MTKLGYYILLGNKFKKLKKDENYLTSYVNVSFVHDDEIRKKSIELFYQMINHEIEQTTNIEQVNIYLIEYLNRK